MGKGMVAILLLGALFAYYCVEARASSPLEIEIEAKLKLLNKSAVKTIQSEDGDIIDCVDIYKQPAFDHPALKDHTIQTIPDFLRESQNSNAQNGDHASEGVVSQIWQRNGSCPNGTIPIRRIRKEDLLRADSLVRFGMKPPAQFRNSTYPHNLHFPNLNANNITMIYVENRSAAYLATMGYNYIGSEADINVWNPNVEHTDEFTTAQIWLKAGAGKDFESVESGWMVNPKLYGDRETRLFALWMRDSYKSTGCFDLTCSGFVQIGTEIALGAAVEPVSSDFGPHYKINVGMFMDNSGNWWLRAMNNVPVGYWPAKILSSLTHSAILVEWGGQVFGSQVRKKPPHTATAMGSGRFASSRFGHACCMQNIRIKDYSLSLKYPQIVGAAADEPYCYSSLNDVKYGVEPVFYFGGPGRNPPHCP